MLRLRMATRILANAGKLNYERVIAHYCRVIRCDRAAFERARAAAFARWEERSRYEWVTDFGFAISDVPLEE